MLAYNDVDSFTGIYICPACVTATGRRTVSEYLFLLTLLTHPGYLCCPRYPVVRETCPLPCCSITSRVFFRINGVLYLQHHVSSCIYQRYLLPLVRLRYLIPDVAQDMFNIAVI